jgi:hypothetical protein
LAKFYKFPAYYEALKFSNDIHEVIMAVSQEVTCWLDKSKPTILLDMAVIFKSLDLRKRKKRCFCLTLSAWERLQNIMQKPGMKMLQQSHVCMVVGGGAERSRNQGDQIGRFFAYWVVVYLGQFIEIFRCSPISWATIIQDTRYVLILSKWVGLQIWAIFSQTHLITLPETNCGPITRQAKK